MLVVFNIIRGCFKDVRVAQDFSENWMQPNEVYFEAQSNLHSCGVYVFGAMRKLSVTDLSTLPDVMFESKKNDEQTEHVRDHCTHVYKSAAVAEWERAGKWFT